LIFEVFFSKTNGLKARNTSARRPSDALTKKTVRRNTLPDARATQAVRFSSHEPLPTQRFFGNKPQLSRQLDYVVLLGSTSSRIAMGQ